MNQTQHAPAPAGRRGLKRRVFVVEDHALMRRSIVEAIEREPDLMVCGQAEAAPEVPAIASHQPDVVLTDIQLKGSSGLDLIKALRTRLPALPIVATTMFDVRRTGCLARAAGASGFVSKLDGPDELIAAIREVLEKGGKHDEKS
jgi:DNA-binding NarL/FixJ family response regulator